MADLPNLKTINLSRNQLTSFPQGGPNQFEAAVVKKFLFASILKILDNKCRAQSYFKNSIRNFFQSYGSYEAQSQRE